MQLDNNRIAIRERTFIDVLDLALRVIRWCAGPLGLALLAGIVPVFVLNAYLLADFEEADFEFGFPATYMVCLVLLIMWEIPLATAPATLYLGQALFEERPSAGRIADSFGKSLPQLLFYQVFIRGILIVPLITWLWLFSRNAYLNEVILLERTPWWGKATANPSTGRRCQTLHSAHAGDLFGRWIGVVALGALLVASCWGSIWIVGGMLLNHWDAGTAMYTFYFQLALWVVVGFFTVVRFLGYLDLRIRREGWEVELAMRAEGARLRESLESGMGET